MSVLSLPSAPANAHNGDMYYNTIEQEYYNFVDGEWVKQVNEDNATTIVQEVVVDEGYLKNTATGNNSLTIGGTKATNNEAVNIGVGSSVGWLATSVGKGSSATGAASTAFGKGATATQMSAVALGTSAEATAVGAIALGTKAKNSEAKTLKVALSDTDGNHPCVDESSGLYTLLNADGKVPVGRYIAMTGADGTNAGTKGVVPTPGATDNTKFLRGDGTWATVDALPSQSGQSGKFLTTDGTDASWDNALQNTATGSNSMSIGGVSSTYGNSMNVGIGSSASGLASTAIGIGAVSNVLLGTAIGRNAVVTANGSIQLGYGTNSTEGTLCVGLATDMARNHYNYELLNSSGIIPIARLGATSGDTNKYLKGDGTWAEPGSNISYDPTTQEITLG